MNELEYSWLNAKSKWLLIKDNCVYNNDGGAQLK